MKTFQAVIDAAFGLAATDRPPQAPSDDCKARNHAFQERAKKIEALRQIRLDSSHERPASLLFEVVRHRGHWRTLHCSKHSSPFADQAAAVLAAKKLARKKRSLGHAVGVVLRRTDGQSVPQLLDDEPEQIG